MPNQFTNPWTPDADNVLREVYEAAGANPVNMDAIAVRLSRTKSSIAHRASRLALTRYGRNRGEGHARVFADRMAAHQATKGHPRGALGHVHTRETRAKMSATHLANPRHYTEEDLCRMSDRFVARRAVDPRVGGSATETYSRAKRGRRDDLGDTFFRSRWEANYARYLNFLIKQRIIAKWEYEPETFWFEAIRRGVRSYTPDFRVTDPDGSVHFDEVKGWMDAKSATKIKRMKKYHPGVEVRVIGEKAYREIARKLGGAIPNWERET
jgi:hypothetical protein